MKQYSGHQIMDELIIVPLTDIDILDQFLFYYI